MAEMVCVCSLSCWIRKSQPKSLERTGRLHDFVTVAEADAIGSGRECGKLESA